MGKFWLGAGLLAALLLGSLWLGGKMTDTHEQLAKTLESAADTATAGDVDAALRIAQETRDQWQRIWHKVAAVADHAPMDEIDSLFAQLQIYGDLGAQAEFAACCSRVAQLLQAVGEAHALSWWNLL